MIDTTGKGHQKIPRTSSLRKSSYLDPKAAECIKPAEESVDGAGPSQRPSAQNKDADQAVVTKSVRFADASGEVFNPTPPV